MRLITLLVVIIVAVAGLFAAFSALTFEPDPIRPLTFNEVDPEQLRQLGLIMNDEKPPVQLDSAQSLIAEQAVKTISQAITTYKAYADRAVPPVNTTIAILNGTIGTGKLPAYFLTDVDPATQKRKYETLRLNLASSIEVQDEETTIKCLPTSRGSTGVLIGNEADNTLFCDIPARPADVDQIFLGGPGDDTITDPSGNRIVNAGSGNDTIRLGAGRSIIVLEEGWGQDSLQIDCAGSLVDRSQLPPKFPVPWVAKYTNFIVLSPRIPVESVVWQGNTLTNIATGDQLTVNENCFTVVGAN